MLARYRASARHRAKGRRASKMINSFDLFVFHAFNGLAGNWTFDRLANFEETNDLLKGALLLALYFFFWFREGTGQEERRLTIISVVAGAFPPSSSTARSRLACRFASGPCIWAGSATGRPPSPSTTISRLGVRFRATWRHISSPSPSASSTSRGASPS